MKRPYVVAVSGISGSGKSSVVRRTAEMLGDAVTIQFDDYAAVSEYPEDLKAWLEQGADVDAFKTPRLAEDLRLLRSGASIELPEERGALSPAAVILLEEPFGRLRHEMRSLIDLVAHLDVPADVLLARRLLRRLDEERHLGDILLERLDRDLRQHLAAGHQLDARGTAAIAAAADVTLDGTRSIDEIAAALAEQIRTYRAVTV